jgi:hypothetical protein
MMMMMMMIMMMMLGVSSAGPISAVPGLHPILGQRCVVLHVSEMFNSG